MLGRHSSTLIITRAERIVVLRYQCGRRRGVMRVRARQRRLVVGRQRRQPRLVLFLDLRDLVAHC